MMPKRTATFPIRHLRTVVSAGLLFVFCFPAVHAIELGAPDPLLRAALSEALDDETSFNDRFEAEVWLLDMSGRLSKIIHDPQERIYLLKHIHSEATRANLPPELVLAVIEVESYFDQFAVSYAGAQGLMQVMPFWLKEIGRPDDNLFHVRTNLRLGCTILRHYLDREKGNVVKALARYNGSVGKTWYPNRVFTRLRNRWQWD